MNTEHTKHPCETVEAEHEVMKLAGMILSDCGCSTAISDRLQRRVAGRIQLHMDSVLGSRQQAEPVNQQLLALVKSFGHKTGCAKNAFSELCTCGIAAAEQVTLCASCARANVDCPVYPQQTASCVEHRPAAQQQAEPVALSLPFFAYDSEVGFERLATEAEAKQFVQDGIDECRSNMLQGEAWQSEIENLCWGVVLGTTKEIKLGKAEDGSGDYYADYVLTDAQPPAVGVPVSDGVTRAIEAVAAAIYFADSSDYLSTLWDTLRFLSPEIAAIAESDTRAAWERAEQDRTMLAAAPQAVATGWIDPNDKTQKQFLPHIGEPVLFCHDGVTYYGQHTGGSFETVNGFAVKFFETWDCLWMYPPAAAQKGGA